MTKSIDELTPGTLAVRVQTLAEKQIEGHKAQASEREARQRELLEGRCVPAGDIGARIAGKPQATYSALNAAELTAEAVLRQHIGISADGVRTSEYWDEVQRDHIEVMHAMLSLGKVVARDTKSGKRVTCGLWFQEPLAELLITRSSFEKFAKVLGVEFEESTSKSLRQDQKENLLDIIGALYQLVTTSKEPRSVRDVAGVVHRIIQNRSERSIRDSAKRGVGDSAKRSIGGKTVRDYLTEAKTRGFEIADESLYADKGTNDT